MSITTSPSTSVDSSSSVSNDDESPYVPTVWSVVVVDDSSVVSSPLPLPFCAMSARRALDPAMRMYAEPSPQYTSCESSSTAMPLGSSGHAIEYSTSSVWMLYL